MEQYVLGLDFSAVFNKNSLIFFYISLWSSKYTLTVCSFPKRMTLAKWSQSTLNKQSVNCHIAPPLPLIFNFYPFFKPKRFSPFSFALLLYYMLLLGTERNSASQVSLMLKNLSANAGEGEIKSSMGSNGFNPWVGKIP